MTSEQREAVSTETVEATDDGAGRLTMEKRDITSLRPHPRNYRRHPEHQLAILRESLRVHGQQPGATHPGRSRPWRLSADDGGFPSQRKQACRGKSRAIALCDGSSQAQMPSHSDSGVNTDD